jgi:hypothetical protein
MLCVSVGHPVRILKRPVRDFDLCRTVLHNGQEYAVKDAVEKLREIAARNGITVGASKLLDRALEGATTIDEEQFNDEEDSMTNETEKPVDADVEVGDNSVPPSSDTKDQPTNGDTTVTKTAKKAPRKAAAKKTPAAKAPKAAKAAKVKASKEQKVRPPSAISKAVAYMREQIEKKGGAKELERGYLKELFAKTAEKYGLKASTCGIQYGRQIKNG